MMCFNEIISKAQIGPVTADCTRTKLPALVAAARRECEGRLKVNTGRQDGFFVVAGVSNSSVDMLIRVNLCEDILP